MSDICITWPPEKKIYVGSETERLVFPEPVYHVTGHRPPKFGGYDEDLPLIRAVKGRIYEQVVQMGPGTWISGGALGSDMWLSEAVLHWRDKRREKGLHDVWHVLAIPFIGYQKSWPDLSQERQQLIFDRTDLTCVIANTGGKYAYHMRNRWMVKKSQHTLAIFDGSKGGTYSTVKYAQDCQRPVITINPVEIYNELPA